MKKILLSLLIGVMILGLSGCKTDGEQAFEELSNIEITDNEIFMTVQDGTLTNTGATFIIENNTNFTIGYGEPYHLEIKKDGKWYILNAINDLVFIEPLWHLEPDNSIELNISWENFYGSLDAGEYRLVKDACFIENDEISEEFYIGVEFIIESD